MNNVTKDRWQAHWRLAKEWNDQEVRPIGDIDFLGTVGRVQAINRFRQHDLCQVDSSGAGDIG